MKKCICVSLLFAIVTHAAQVASYFETDMDGWALDVGSGGSLTQESTGGYPGGYLHFTDGASTPGDVLAPVKFVGDWKIYDNAGTLSWSHRIVEAPHVNSIINLRATITGEDGSVAVFRSEQAPSLYEWVTITAPITEDSWEVLTGTWSNLLENVIELRIKIEVVDGVGDSEGLDGIILRNNSIRTNEVEILKAVAIRFFGESGITYQVQRTFDFETWNNFESAQSGNDEYIVIYDLVDSHAKAFYRYVEIE